MKIKRFAILFLAMLLLVVPLAPREAMANSVVPVTGQFRQTEARRQLDLINQFRTRGGPNGFTTGEETWYWNSDNSTKTTYPSGMSALTYDYTLEQVAMQRAAEIAVSAVYFSHTRPNGKDCFTAFPSGYQSKGENIAMGTLFESAESVYLAFREDECSYSGQGHRQNMLNTGFTAVGIACFYYNGEYYWAQEFGSPNKNASYTSPNDGAATVQVEIQDGGSTQGLAPKITGGTYTSVSYAGATGECEVYAEGGEDFQWYSLAPGDSTWRAVSENSGKTAHYTFTIEEKHHGYRFKCVVSNDFGSVESSECELILSDMPPVVLDQPKNASVNVGASTSFRVNALCYHGIAYQWQYRKSGSSAWTDVSDADANSLTVTGAYYQNGWQYRCKMTGDYGTTYSDPATLTVFPSQYYTVSFNANGGTCATASKSVAYTGTYGTLPTPTRSGYTFDGWYTAKTGGKKVTASTVCYATGDYTLYARWTSVRTYTVTLNPNGGTCGTGSKTVTYGKAYGTMPVPTRKGYTFAGWWTAKTGGKKVTASTICYASGNYTLYARWTEGYTMTFDPNGGTCTTKTKVVKYGQAYGTLPTPTKAGYTFAGWWTAKTGGKQVTASTVCYASAGYTLYARWTAKKFVITLNPNGGECATKTKTVTYGQAYGTMPVPSPRTGYTFAGWYTAKTGGKKVTATTVCYATGNYTLYARWTPKTYTVTLNPNGGSCSTATKKVTYGQTYGTMPAPTRSGYVFAGWWTKKDSGGKQVFSSTTCYATGNYTLYARWWVN